MNDRDGGSAEETPRTVADLLAQYGDGAVSSGGRRRRRATDPEETAPQSIIDRVLSDSGTMRRVDENGHPVPLPPSSGRPTGSHRPVVTPLPPPPPPRPAGPAPGAASPLPPRGAARPAPPRMAPPNAGRPIDDLGHNSPAGDTGVHRYDTGSHRYDTGSHRPDTGSHRPDTGPQRPDTGPQRPDTGSHRPDTGPQRPDTGSYRGDNGPHRGDNGAKPYGAPESGPHRYQPSETGPHRYPPSPQSPQSPQSDTGRYSPTETGPHRYNPADTGAQRPVPADRGPADRGLRPDDSRPIDLGRAGGRDALRRDPARREEDATDKFPRIESVTLNPTGAPPAARPGRRGRHQPELDEPAFDPGPPRMPARPLAAPPMAPPVAPAPPVPPPPARPTSLSGPDVDRRFAGDRDGDHDDLDDELDDDYDDEFDDDEDDDFDDDESPVKEWLVMAGQLAVGAVGGAGLWLGFQWLWRAMPLVSLGVALVVITALVWVVRRIRRSDDLQTTVVTVLVGLFVTVSPAALLLVSR